MLTPSSQKYADAYYWEAECIKIDPENKKVYCRSNLSTNGNGKEEFSVDYDYLVIATGARVNTFNIPGVEENTFFLKVIPLYYTICKFVIPQDEEFYIIYIT